MGKSAPYFLVQFRFEHAEEFHEILSGRLSEVEDRCLACVVFGAQVGWGFKHRLDQCGSPYGQKLWNQYITFCRMIEVPKTYGCQKCLTPSISCYRHPCEEEGEGGGDDEDQAAQSFHQRKCWIVVLPFVVHYLPSLFSVIFDERPEKWSEDITSYATWLNQSMLKGITNANLVLYLALGRLPDRSRYEIEDDKKVMMKVPTVQLDS